MRDDRFIACLGGLLSLFLAAQAQAAPAGRIVFLSDFGTIDDAVSQCKAAIFREYPEAQIVDMTHQIPPYDVRLASFLLANAAKVWPAGTVFLAVVDPGVGSSRRPIAVETRSGHFFVGPDNGIFTLPIKSLGLRRAVALDVPAGATTTFHGRDVFAPAAGRLLKSPEALASMGAEVRDPFLQDWETPKKASGTASGRVLHVEKPFGNVWTDIGPETLQENEILPGSTVQVSIGGKDLSVPLVRTFSDVPKGRPLAYFNSRGLFSLALNMDDFAGKFGVESGDPVSVAPSETALVDVRVLAGDRVSFDIKYATPKNFTGKKVYPSDRCYLRRDAAASLLRAAELAAAVQEPFRLCVYDCYRPLSVQELFWKIMPDPRYVADPAKGSAHNRGFAVDLTACDNQARPLPMPSEFDDFSEKAHRDYSGGSPQARLNRARLEEVMLGAGFKGLATEWWHFSLPAGDQAEVLDLPLPK